MKEYRGKIPFLLKEIGGKILYLCSSNRNIEDYYNVLSSKIRRRFYYFTFFRSYFKRILFRGKKI